MTNDAVTLMQSEVIIIILNLCNRDVLIETCGLNHLMIRGLWNFDIQRPGEDGVPAGADVSLAIHWEEDNIFSVWQVGVVYHVWTSAHAWCLSPSTRRIHTGRSAAANWDGSAPRPSRFSDGPGLRQCLRQSALQAWHDLKNEHKSYMKWEERKHQNSYAHRISSMNATWVHLSLFRYWQNHDRKVFLTDKGRIFVVVVKMLRITFFLPALLSPTLPMHTHVICVSAPLWLLPLLPYLGLI